MRIKALLKRLMIAALMLVLCVTGIAGFIPKNSFAQTKNTESGGYQPVVDMNQPLNVYATDDKIILTGTTSGSGAADIVELPCYEHYSETSTGDKVASVTLGQEYTQEIDRFQADGEDRVYDHFYIVQNGNVIAGPIFATDMPSARTYEFLQPTSIKGLQIQMVDDAEKLGVQNAAFNYGIEGLMYASEPENKNLAIEYESNGQKFWFKKSIVEKYDKQVKSLSDNKMEVTAIVLLWASGVGSTARAMVHPDFDPTDARIAAVNVTDAEGVAMYRALMEFLADRYTREDEKYGRIVNFVIGNEVDAPALWNNMGYQQIDEYVEQYARQFRIAYTAIRKFHSRARTLISMDFCWTAKPFNNPNYTKIIDGVEYSMEYRGKDILDKFAVNLRSEGDIEWALAHHPYPEDLFDAKFWEDTQATGDVLTTPKINFNNLELLVQYLRDNYQYRGKNRTIMLTEQGFNTRDPSSPEDQRIQAAAYALAYYKIKTLPEIHAFILHRHVDCKPEDGLNLGLWERDRNSDTTPTKKKLIYDVFRLIDTEKSFETTQFALDVIGISDWSEKIWNFNDYREQIEKGEVNSIQVSRASVSEGTANTMVSDFENENLDGWEIAEYATKLSTRSILPIGDGSTYKGDCLTVNFSAGSSEGGAMAEKGVFKKFAQPIDASPHPHFRFAVNAPAGADSYEVTVRFYSGREITEAKLKISPEEWSSVVVDIGDWQYKNKIDKIKIWMNNGTDTSAYSGMFYLDEIGFYDENAGTGSGCGSNISVSLASLGAVFLLLALVGGIAVKRKI